MDKYQVEKEKRRIVEGKCSMRKNGLKTMRRSKITTREWERRRLMKQRKRREFVCQREDQEITKTGSKKWKVQEESKHYYIMDGRQQQNRNEREWEFIQRMQGTRLYGQSFRERLQSDTGTGRMTRCCTAKNNRTAWVRGCRGTSWNTRGRKTKYIAARIQLMTKCMIRQNTVKRI